MHKKKPVQKCSWKSFSLVKNWAQPELVFLEANAKAFYSILLSNIKEPTTKNKVTESKNNTAE